MIVAAYLMDIAAFAGIEAAAGVAFFLIFAAVAYVAFRILKRTTKIAIRALIASIILFVATLGAIFIWYALGSRSAPVRPPASRTR